MVSLRKICAALIILVYALGTVPPFMGWYNRPATLFGIPVFMLGIGGLSFLMILIMAVLYRYEDKHENQGGGSGNMKGGEV